MKLIKRRVEGEMLGGAIISWEYAHFPSSNTIFGIYLHFWKVDFQFRCSVRI